MVGVQPSLTEQVIVRAVVLGAIGGACGFFGPIYFDPGAAQGPLVGIFFTGPLGLLLGAGLGLLFHRLSLRPWAREGIFISVAFLFGAGVLFLCQPGDELSGFLVDAEIVKCETPDARAESAATKWADTALHNPQLEQRSAWRAGISQLLHDDPGVVLTGKVWRRREIYLSREDRARHRWKPGHWTPKQYQDTFFARYAGNRCSDYSIGSRGVYWTHVGHNDTAFPPANSADFLSLFVIEPVPRDMESLSR